MEKYQDNVQNRNGKAVEGASVRVHTYPAGDLATIYSDNGITQAANPLTTVINASAGQTIRVLGDANVTLKHGSGIITTTGADLPLADNTMYTLTFIAGFWRM